MIKFIIVLLFLFSCSVPGKSETSRVEYHLNSSEDTLTFYPFYEPKSFTEMSLKTLKADLSKSLMSALDDYTRLTQGIARNKHARAIYFDWLKAQKLTSKKDNFFILYGMYIILTTSKDLEKDEIKKMKIFVTAFKLKKRAYKYYQRMPSILKHLFIDLKKK